jgi:hypothetical protein
MAGLDNIKKYAAGSTVEADTEDTSTEKQAPLSAKAAASKFLPTPTGPGTGVTPELLENMQKMIAEREAQRNSFMENLKDATAWWSGGVQGPGEALSRRAKEREEQALTTFGMKRDLAQYKVAQEQAQNLQRQLFGGTPGAAGSTTPTGAPGVGAAPQASGGLLDLVQDPGLRQSIAVQAQTDQVGAQKAIQSYLAANAKNPDIIKKVNYMLQNGMIDKSMVPQIMLTEAVGASAFTPHDVRGATGTMQTTPLGSAGAFVRGGAPAAGAPAAAPAARPAAPVAAPVAAPAAAPAAAPTAAPAAAPAAPAAAKPALPHTTPIPKINAPTAAESPVEAQIRAAGLDPTSKEANEIRAKAGETLVTSRGKQMAKSEEGAGERLTKMRELAEAARTTKPTAQVVIDIADNPKLNKVMGFAHGSDSIATGLTTIGDFIPGVGADKTEKALYSNYLNDTERKAYKDVQSAAQKLGIDFAADVFKGARMGIGLEKMAMGAKGIGTEMPAAVNKQNAALIRDAADFQQQKNEMFERWAETHGGEFADFNKFETSPEYLAFSKKAEQHFLNTYKGIVKPLTAGPDDHPGAALVDRYKSKNKKAD